MFCPLGALRVAKGVCDFCDETTLEEMRECVFSYFENSNTNAFFKTCFGGKRRGNSGKIMDSKMIMGKTEMLYHSTYKNFI
jgi:hypothetical protein